MTEFSYETETKHGATYVKVRLGRRIIGEIHKTTGGYHYRAQGKLKYAGDVFPTVADVKNSIEAE